MVTEEEYTYCSSIRCEHGIKFMSFDSRRGGKDTSSKEERCSLPKEAGEMDSEQGKLERDT